MTEKEFDNKIIERYVKYIRKKDGVSNGNEKIIIKSIRQVKNDITSEYAIIYEIGDRFLIKTSNGWYFNPIYITKGLYFKFAYREEKLKRILND